MLVRALNGAQPVITLHWFCYQQKNNSVYSMLKSLVCQLLDKSGGLAIQAQFAEGGRFTIGNMAGFFLRCLEVQLRSVSVFIMLDSLSYYEGSGRIRDLCWLLDRIAEAVNSPPHSSGHTLKALVTSPTRLSSVGPRLQARGGILLDVPSHVDSTRVDADDRRLLTGVQERLSSSLRLYDH